MTTNYNTYLKCGIWECWHELSWEDYDDEFYRDTVMDLAVPDNTSNVILYGNNGSGKTMLLNLAMKELVDSGKSVYVIDFRNLIKEHTKSWFNSDDSMLPDLMLKDFLAIDDLGKEFGDNSEKGKELAITTLDYVLRYRVQRMKPTWFTFNLPLASVKTLYNEHIASLMKRNTVSVRFDNADYGDRFFTTITKPALKGRNTF